MSSTLQQGIPYGDRPLGNLQGNGVYATPEFLQYLERLHAMAKTAPSSSADLQTQVTGNANAITTINNTIATMQATEANMQSDITALQSMRPTQWFEDHTSAVALTSGTAATVMAQTVFSGTWMVMAACYFTGSGTITWGRASVGSNAATIETVAGQAGNFYAGSASPGSLGWDLAITGLTLVYVNNVPGTVYVNASASFSGSISAYATLIAQPL